MTRWNNLGKPARNDDRRSSGRMRQESLACSLGPVIDLSAGGMKILSRKVPTGQLIIDIFSSEDSIRVTGEVSWVKKTGMFQPKEVGIRFINNTDEMKRILTRMSMINRVARGLHYDRSEQDAA